jgi:hypothetical protein
MKKTHSDWKHLCALAVLAGGTVLITALWGCIHSMHGATLLYESHQGRRLPGNQVARVLLHELWPLRQDIAVALDSATEVGYRDTLEILPGSHTLQIALWPPGRSPKARIFPEIYPVLQHCTQFVFVAKAGHEYECRMPDHDSSSWRWHIELVDLQRPTNVFRNFGCEKQAWWPISRE